MSFLITLKDYLQIIKINYLDNMKTKTYWEKQYKLIIEKYHLYNKKEYSLEEFLSFPDEKKENIISYYKNIDVFKADLNISPCPNAELCNFLYTEKEEKINSNQIRKEIESITKQIRKIRSKFPRLRTLMKELNSLRKLLEEVEKEERKISEETLWSKKMSNFKQSLNK